MKQQTLETPAARSAFAGLPRRARFAQSSRNDSWEDGIDWSADWIERAGLKPEPELLRIGSSLVDRRTGKVETPTGQHRLRQKELELLMHLFQHADITFTREELLQAVWNYHCRLLTRTVDQTIATLRKKIELSPERPRLIQTVYGIGYRLVL